MSRNHLKEAAPIVSVTLIVFTLFSLVFLKMEVRRIGYSLVKQHHEFKRLQDLYRAKLIEYAQTTSPERLRSLAQRKLTLTEADVGQIIHMSGDQIAFKQ